MAISKPATRDAQEPSASRCAISGHKERDAFISAALVCDGLTPLELRIAVRLAMFFNCTTGQCNPGYPRLAKALDIAPRSARRSVAALVIYGIVEEERATGGGHENKTKFRLFMPPARVTRITSPVGLENANDERATNSTLTGDEQMSGRVTPRGPHNTDRNTEQSDPSDRALSERVFSTAACDVTPVTDAALIPVKTTASAATSISETKRDSAFAGRLVPSEIDQSKIERPVSVSSSFLATRRTPEIGNGHAASRSANPPQPQENAMTPDRERAFEIVKRCYPKDRIDDDDKNTLEALDLALGYNSLDELIQGAIEINVAANRGEQVLELVEFLISRCVVTSLAA